MAAQTQAQQAGKSYRARLVAQIHIARKDLALDDDAYRLLLETETGQRSCADLSVSQLTSVLKRMQVSGWKPQRKRSPMTRSHKAKSVIDKLRAVWINMERAGMLTDGSEVALEAWVRRQTSRINGKGVDRVDWLETDPVMAAKVLESLKQWQSRVLSQWVNDDMRLISQEQQRTDLPQVDVIRKLLAAQRIFYWPIFDDLGIEPVEPHIQDRRLLRHE